MPTPRKELQHTDPETLKIRTLTKRKRKLIRDRGKYERDMIWRIRDNGRKALPQDAATADAIAFLSRQIAETAMALDPVLRARADRMIAEGEED